MEVDDDSDIEEGDDVMGIHKASSPELAESPFCPRLPSGFEESPGKSETSDSTQSSNMSGGVQGGPTGFYTGK